jgi:hypothetical protein
LEQTQLKKNSDYHNDDNQQNQKKIDAIVAAVLHPLNSTSSPRHRPAHKKLPR